MDENEVLLVSKQGGEIDGTVGTLQLVIADRLVGEPAAQLGQILLGLIEFQVGGFEFFIELSVGIGHGILLAKNQFCNSSP